MIDDSQLGRTHGGNSKVPKLGFFQPESQSHEKRNPLEVGWHVPFPQYTKPHTLIKSSTQTTPLYHRSATN